jgi:integrase
MDPWGWEQLRPWLDARVELPVGPLFCIIDGPTRGRSWSSAGVRVEFRRLAAQAGVRRRFAPHQLRHAHAVELAREGVPLNVIQRQLGHANLGTNLIYLQRIDTEEIIATVHARRTDDVRDRRTPTLINPSPNSGNAAHAPAGRSCWATASRPNASATKSRLRPPLAPGCRPKDSGAAAPRAIASASLRREHRLVRHG